LWNITRSDGRIRRGLTKKGVPGKVVAQLMGHVKVDTTLNIYTHVIDGALRAAADKVGSELFTIVHRPENGAMLTH
jgi:integrase